MTLTYMGTEAFLNISTISLLKMNMCVKSCLNTYLQLTGHKVDMIG